MQPKLIIAHRGASAYAEENTLSAFEQAIALKADMIEFDVRRTQDQVLIAYHDEYLLGRPISRWTYQDIKQQNSRIPTLEQVLQLANSRIQLDVELKEVGYEQTVINLLFQYFEPKQFVITSFNRVSLQTIKHLSSEIKTGLLLGRTGFKDFKQRRTKLGGLKKVPELNADFLAPNWKLLRLGFLQPAKTHQPMFVWTVNHELTIWKLLKDERVEGIITDVPDVAIALRNRLTD